MIDRDLAELYGVETKRLKEAVRRNIERFPEDFMFEMDKKEFESWRGADVTALEDRQGLRYAPFCFTEQAQLPESFRTFGKFYLTPALHEIQLPSKTCRCESLCQK
jgi:hypothetical protein